MGDHHNPPRWTISLENCLLNFLKDGYPDLTKLFKKIPSKLLLYFFINLLIHCKYKYYTLVSAALQDIVFRSETFLDNMLSHFVNFIEFMNISTSSVSAVFPICYCMMISLYCLIYLTMVNTEWIHGVYLYFVCNPENVLDFIDEALELL